MDSEEIQKAIGAHGMWKSRLAAAIVARRSDVTPEQVEPDNTCAFGKWLQALPGSDQSSAHFKKVKPLHAAFHKTAAQVLRMALSGQKAEAEKSMATGGLYRKASADLTDAMMQWRKALGA